MMKWTNTRFTKLVLWTLLTASIAGCATLDGGAGYEIDEQCRLRVDTNRETAGGVDFEYERTPEGGCKVKTKAEGGLTSGDASALWELLKRMPVDAG